MHVGESGDLSKYGEFLSKKSFLKNYYSSKQQKNYSFLKQQGTTINQ